MEKKNSDLVLLSVGKAGRAGSPIGPLEERIAEIEIELDILREKLDEANDHNLVQAQVSLSLKIMDLTETLNLFKGAR